MFAGTPVVPLCVVLLPFESLDLQKFLDHGSQTKRIRCHCSLRKVLQQILCHLAGFCFAGAQVSEEISTGL